MSQRYRLEQDRPGLIELAFLLAIVGSILLLAAWVLGWHLPF
jgi:hypothetical protein